MPKEKIKSLIDKINNNKYNILLIIALLLIFIFSNHKVSKIETKEEDNYTRIFVQDTCIHCRDLEAFLTQENIKKYNIKYLDIEENTSTLIKLANKNNISLNTIGTPIIFTKYGYRIGFVNNERNKDDLIKFLDQSIEINKTKENIKTNDFVETIKAVFFSVFNLYSILLIIGTVSLTILLNNEKKSNIIFCCIMFSIPIISFLFLIDWLNVYLMSLFTRTLNLFLSLILMYYVIKNFYYLKKENKNLFDKETALNRHFSMFIVLLSFLFNTINITRNSNILYVNSILYFIIYSILLAIFFTCIVYTCYSILKNKKNYLIFNSVLFCVLFYIIFLLKY